MPRVRPLTRVEQEMRDDKKAVERASDEFLDLLGIERGRLDMTRQDFADYIGVTRQTYYNWRKDGIGKTSLELLVATARRSGFKVQFSLEENPR